MDLDAWSLHSHNICRRFQGITVSLGNCLGHSSSYLALDKNIEDTLHKILSPLKTDYLYRCLRYIPSALVGLVGKIQGSLCTFHSCSTFGSIHKRLIHTFGCLIDLDAWSFHSHNICHWSQGITKSLSNCLEYSSSCLALGKSIEGTLHKTLSRWWTNYLYKCLGCIPSALAVLVVKILDS